MRIVKTKTMASALLITVSISLVIYAHSTGITEVTKKNGNGCTCHNATPSTVVTVNINGPVTMAPGATANFTLTVSGGPLDAAGTNIAASSGTLIAQAGLKLLGDELTHTSPKAPVNGVVTFNFSFTAPSSQGSVTLFANGNSVNLNGNNSGDQWNFASNKIITVANASGVKEDAAINNYKLDQNFPNPFNPSTIISYSLLSNSYVSLKIFDVTGKEIKSLINKEQSAGSYSFPFNAASLSSGIYYYTLKAGNYSETKKMILTK